MLCFTRHCQSLLRRVNFWLRLCNYNRGMLWDPWWFVVFSSLVTYLVFCSNYNWLHGRIGSLVDELQRQKLKNAQVSRVLKNNHVSNRHAEHSLNVFEHADIWICFSETLTSVYNQNPSLFTKFPPLCLVHLWSLLN